MSSLSLSLLTNPPLLQIGLSESEVLHEVNALSDKIHSQSLEELKGKKKQLLKKFESRRSTLVTELSLVRFIILADRSCFKPFKDW